MEQDDPRRKIWSYCFAHTCGDCPLLDSTVNTDMVISRCKVNRPNANYQRLWADIEKKEEQQHAQACQG